MRLAATSPSLSWMMTRRKTACRSTQVSRRSPASWKRGVQYRIRAVFRLFRGVQYKKRAASHWPEVQNIRKNNYKCCVCVCVISMLIKIGRIRQFLLKKTSVNFCFLTTLPFTAFMKHPTIFLTNFFYYGLMSTACSILTWYLYCKY